MEKYQIWICLALESIISFFAICSRFYRAGRSCEDL